MIRRIVLPPVAVEALLLHRVGMRVRVGIEVGDVLNMPESVSPLAQHVKLVDGGLVNGTPSALMSLR